MDFRPPQQNGTINQSQNGIDRSSQLNRTSIGDGVPRPTNQETQNFIEKYTGNLKPTITAVCCLCRRVKKSIWFSHPIFTFVVCARCYSCKCREGEKDLVMAHSVVQNSCAICKTEFYCTKTAKQLVGYIECSRCILRFCFGCVNVVLTLNGKRMVKSCLNEWACFRCEPRTLNHMLRNADLILTRQFEGFMEDKIDLNMRLDYEELYKHDSLAFSAVTPLELKQKNTNILALHDDFQLDLRDRIHLKPYQLKSIKFLYERIVGCLEEWHKDIQSGSGESCCLVHQDCLGKRLTVVAFLKAFLKTKYSKNTKVLIVIDRNNANDWINDFQFLMPSSMFTSKSVFCGRYYQMLNLEADYNGWGEIFQIAVIDYAQYIKHISQSKSLFESVDGPSLTIFDNYDQLIELCPFFEIYIHKIHTKKKLFLSNSEIYNDKIIQNFFINKELDLEVFMKCFYNLDFMLSFKFEKVNHLVKKFKTWSHIRGKTADEVEQGKIRIFREINLEIRKSIYQLKIPTIIAQLPVLHEFQVHLHSSLLQVNIYKHILKYVVDNKLKFGDYVSLLRCTLLHPSSLGLKPAPKPENKFSFGNLNDLSNAFAINRNGCNRDHLDYHKKVLFKALHNTYAAYFVSIRNRTWSMKVEFLLRLLSVCSNKTLKIVVFSEEISFFDYFEAALASLFQISLRTSKPSTSSVGVSRWKNGVNYLRIKPQKLTIKEQLFINNFNNDRLSQASLCLVKVSKHMPDINLRGAGVVICMEPMTTNQYHRCLNCVYRSDQKDSVTAVTMISKTTFEDYFLENQDSYNFDSLLLNDQNLEKITPTSFVNLNRVPTDANEERFPPEHFLSAIKASLHGIAKISKVCTYSQ